MAHPLWQRLEVRWVQLLLLLCQVQVPVQGGP